MRGPIPKVTLSPQEAPIPKPKVTVTTTMSALTLFLPSHSELVACPDPSHLGLREAKLDGVWKSLNNMFVYGWIVITFAVLLFVKATEAYRPAKHRGTSGLIQNMHIT